MKWAAVGPYITGTPPQGGQLLLLLFPEKVPIITQNPFVTNILLGTPKTVVKTVYFLHMWLLKLLKQRYVTTCNYMYNEFTIMPLNKSELENGTSGVKYI